MCSTVQEQITTCGQNAIVKIGERTNIRPQKKVLLYCQNEGNPDIMKNKNLLQFDPLGVVYNLPVTFYPRSLIWTATYLSKHLVLRNNWAV